MRTILKLILAATLALGGVLAAQAETSKLKLEEIFAIYDQVNGFDIETAELGAVKGHSAQVRQLAVMVLRDHSAVRQMACDIASDESVDYLLDEKSKSATQHAEKLARLNALSGEAFDRAYLLHERDFHERAIKAIESKLLVDSKSEELDAHFKAVLPGFKQHLAVTIATMRELDVE